MKHILIIKTGSTMPTLRQKRGDFEDWILTGMQSDKIEVTILDVTKGTPLPSPEHLYGIVITGSHAMVTEHQDWCEETAQWLRGSFEKQIPTLGICYGHQLLAYAAGGRVGNNPNGLEFGTVDVHLNEIAEKDPLFKDLPRTIQVHVSHTQSIFNLPPGTRTLASNSMETHHAFVLGDCVWGMQFHPEFDAEITRAYIGEHREAILQEGNNTDRLIETCVDTPHGSRLLQQFAAIVREKIKCRRKLY